jgi:UDP-glucose 4-epimerase
MKILITGSSGYLGKILVSDFINRKIEVIGIDIKENPEENPGEFFHFYRCCITDRNKLREIFLKENPTDVIHFACTFNKVRNRKKEYEIDIGGSLNIMELSNETPSVKRLIYSSSAAVYGVNGRNNIWLKETDLINPRKYRYGENKKMIEEAYSTDQKRTDLHIVSLRICTVVGPAYAKPKSVVSLLIRLPYLPKSFRESKIQFLHEVDFITLIYHVLQDEEIEGLFNLATDTYSVVNEIVPEKKYINFPILSIKPILWILWNLRLLNLQPASLRYTLKPIILDPSKLISRFSYRFNYSSSEAFISTRQNNRLPPDSRF